MSEVARGGRSCKSITSNIFPHFKLQYYCHLQVKSQHLEFFDLIKYFVEHAREMQQTVPQKAMIESFEGLQLGIYIISSVFAAETLTKYLLNDKLKTYLAVWLSSVIIFPAMALLAMFKMLVLYNYIN
jgi:hypothetical protein